MAQGSIGVLSHTKDSARLCMSELRFLTSQVTVIGVGLCGSMTFHMSVVSYPCVFWRGGPGSIFFPYYLSLPVRVYFTEVDLAVYFFSSLKLPVPVPVYFTEVDLAVYFFSSLKLPVPVVTSPCVFYRGGPGSIFFPYYLSLPVRVYFTEVDLAVYFFSNLKLPVPVPVYFTEVYLAVYFCLIT